MKLRILLRPFLTATAIAFVSLMIFVGETAIAAVAQTSAKATIWGYMEQLRESGAATRPGSRQQGNFHIRAGPVVRGDDGSTLQEVQISSHGTAMTFLVERKNGSMSASFHDLESIHGGSIYPRIATVLSLWSTAFILLLVGGESR